MTHKYLFFFAMFISMLTSMNTIHGDLFNPISSFFGGKPYETIIEKDYTLENNGRISIKNTHGNISVRTGLDKKSVAVRAIKRAKAQEHLDHMHIIEEEVVPTKLMLRTAYDYEKVKGTVDYIITVPENAILHLNTDTGDIDIHQVHGTIIAATGSGNIIVEQPTDKVKATITQQGNITINQPKGNVQAMSNKGTVQIRDSAGNLSVNVNQGKIDIRCKSLPAKREIRCSIKQGNILLYLPHNIQTSIIADAQEGTITSTQPITLKSSTTVLNNDYWAHVKKHVEGHINNEAASIHLSANHGDIKLFSIP